MSTLSSQESKNVFLLLPHDQMTDCPDLTQTCAIHADLISNLEAFYRTLIDLDYLREGEVQSAPHTGEGKTALARTAILSSGRTEEAQQLLHLLPYVTHVASRRFDELSPITLSSMPLSYLDQGKEGSTYGENFFGFGDGGDEPPLPPWAILLFTGTNSSQKLIIYDTRRSKGICPLTLVTQATHRYPGKVSELSIYEPSEEALEAAATSSDALIGTWVQNLRTLI